MVVLGSLSDLQELNEDIFWELLDILLELLIYCNRVLATDKSFAYYQPGIASHGS
jgi:hypothetical protein